MRLSRRRLLQVGSAVVGAVAAGLARPGLAHTASATGGTRGRGEPSKRLALRNLHTDEHVEVEFWRGGSYVPESLAAIQGLLRDHRNGAQHVIDAGLLECLSDAARRAGVEAVFAVISGYRSPQPEAPGGCRAEGARPSLHRQGRAIDVRLAGVTCEQLALCARQAGVGGVGYYKTLNFVHLDTGVHRTWNG